MTPVPDDSTATSDPTPPAAAHETAGPHVPAPPVPVPPPDTGYTAGGVPTLDGVREKIETRYGTALGATELAAETPEVRDAAERYDATHKAAAEKLAEIRAAMHEQDPTTPAP